MNTKGWRIRFGTCLKSTVQKYKASVLPGVLGILFKGLLAGVANVIFFSEIMNPITGSAKSDEVAVNTYTLNFFVGWVFFSAYFLAQAGEEWKKVAEAVAIHDKKGFDIEAPKRIVVSIRILYLLISALAVMAFHLFHITSTLVLAEIQFGVGFFVAMTILVLWDMDDPVHGVINVPNIPEEWVK